MRKLWKHTAHCSQLSPWLYKVVQKKKKKNAFRVIYETLPKHESSGLTHWARHLYPLSEESAFACMQFESVLMCNVSRIKLLIMAYMSKKNLKYVYIYICMNMVSIVNTFLSWANLAHWFYQTSVIWPTIVNWSIKPNVQILKLTYLKCADFCLSVSEKQGRTASGESYDC